MKKGIMSSCVCQRVLSQYTLLRYSTAQNLVQPDTADTSARTPTQLRGLTQMSPLFLSLRHHWLLAQMTLYVFLTEPFKVSLCSVFLKSNLVSMTGKS